MICTHYNNFQPIFHWWVGAALYGHPRSYSPYQWGVFSKTRDPYFGNPLYDQYPAIMLDSDEALAYCRWAGRRLPSEAEWEKAARDDDRRTYPWGEDIDCQKANYAGCVGDTSQVNSHLQGASPYGVLDMAGNLWEWVMDWYAADAYSHTSVENPNGPEQGAFRTLRGGAWGSGAEYLRTTSRSSGKAEHWFDGQIGFRCALSVADTHP